MGFLGVWPAPEEFRATTKDDEKDYDEDYEKGTGREQGLPSPRRILVSLDPGLEDCLLLIGAEVALGLKCFAAEA